MSNPPRGPRLTGQVLEAAIAKAVSGLQDSLPSEHRAGVLSGLDLHSRRGETEQCSLHLLPPARGALGISLQRSRQGGGGAGTAELGQAGQPLTPSPTSRFLPQPLTFGLLCPGVGKEVEGNMTQAP